MTVESYGTSYEGRDLWLATITDRRTGAHDTKPAHWVDANIHSVEVTAQRRGVHLIQRLVDRVRQRRRPSPAALQTRTFYVVPRVNPDGVEWALADRPRYRRSSVRPWPWRDAHRAPGSARARHGRRRAHPDRCASPIPNGAWIDRRPRTPRVLRARADRRAPRRHGAALPAAVRGRDRRPRRLHDPDAAPARGPRHEPQLPGGLGHRRARQRRPSAERAGDRRAGARDRRPAQRVRLQRLPHVRRRAAATVVARKPDSSLPPLDVWAWKQLGERGTALTGYPVHSVFEDFTFDKTDTMSGAADDWAYEHLGIFGGPPSSGTSCTLATGTQAVDPLLVHRPDRAGAAGRAALVRRAPSGDVRATGTRSTIRSSARSSWAAGTTCARGPIRRSASLRAEVQGHADFAIYQALAAPCVEILHAGSRRTRR